MKSCKEVLWMLLLCLALTGCAADTEYGGDTGSRGQTDAVRVYAGEDYEYEDAEAAENGQVLISFLKTQEDADCIILSSGERAVMIDTGEAQDGERILAALEERGITVIDYLILTHPDKDHVGGAALVLENLPVLQVVEPVYRGDKEKEERFEVLNEYCEEEGIPVICPIQELTVSTKYLDATIYPPEETYYKQANNYSLAVLVCHGEVNMFFAGDALRIRSQELLEIPLPEIDLYKVPHHGRANKMTEELFEAVCPEYAVVTAGAAEEEVIRSCDKVKAQLFLTGVQDWDFVSDGDKIWVEESGLQVE